MKLSVLFFLFSLFGFAQYTAIPDINFENKLIALGIDSGVADGQVLTANIANRFLLNVSNSGIRNLSGIQDFTKLTTLYCQDNLLTSLDVSQNKKLNYLDCSNNALTSLNISGSTDLATLNCETNQLSNIDFTTNPVLYNLYCNSNKLTNLNLTANPDLNFLYCYANQLTSLSVTTNTKLTRLYCQENQITSLDISTNTALKEFFCRSNQLTSLNLKNGTSSSITSFNATSNPNLTCIQVDDVAYFNTNWATQKDATATYNTACSNLGVPETVFEKMSLYPNPTQGELHIDHIVLEKATLYDASGKLLKTTKFTSATQSSTLNMEAFSKGMYYLFLESEGTHTVKKIVVE
ncbi:T9SS type A sorting domain-containing protein [Flavobacterium sp. ANB]|uniref:T9SS type A sorting domain-containing protein n=1 Tax=unclassified Flavobacterium TaxID=196869 RepID=UPI0012B76E0F|nr:MULTISPECIES: T9SS type A sorting domain-containing protein [unclassified Flavobacterium]MBF4519047.1 T9SS type A sorting domain-containing protein [Flavobacterium sp. ANB]MTD71753.1 T9SS type A sorting domain-containing protein [Flavobacterium sp. LC2016-13]